MELNLVTCTLFKMIMVCGKRFFAMGNIPRWEISLVLKVKIKHLFWQDKEISDCPHSVSQSPGVTYIISRRFEIGYKNVNINKLLIRCL